jgi:hypothetical protein
VQYKVIESATKERARAAFDSVDRERSGTVFVSELRQLFRALTDTEPTDRQWKTLNAMSAHFKVSAPVLPYEVLPFVTFVIPIYDAGRQIYL